MPHLTSRYVAARDGTRLAVDVYLPDGYEGDRQFPALIRSTRYLRRPPDQPDAELPTERGIVTAADIVLVVVDVRGTGASFGRWPGTWDREQIDDLSDVVTWVCAQPWSNGRVGAYGVSYDGNTAELLGATGNPAVVATAPRFADFDAFAHLAFPGGVPLVGFLEFYGAYVQILDHDDQELLAELRTRFPDVEPPNRPTPVDGDDGEQLRAAIAEHAQTNALLHELTIGVESRDDPRLRPLAGSDPIERLDELASAGVPMFPWASWLDAGTALGAVQRFQALPNPQETWIGPWAHGARFRCDPFAVHPGREEDLRAHWDAVLTFFAPHLRGDDAPADTRRIRWWTLGEGTWRSADRWPPPGSERRTLYLHGTALDTERPAAPSLVEYVVDATASSGPSNRWWTQLGGERVDYGDRRTADEKLLVFDTAPLERATRVTGSPVLSLRLAVDRPDAAVFAYLECVDPDGHVRMLTEGMLRLQHRAVRPGPAWADPELPHHTYLSQDMEAMRPGTPETVRFALFPTAALVPRGHRLRLALAGADAESFALIPADGSVTWEVHLDGESSLSIPILPDGVAADLQIGAPGDASPLPAISTVKPIKSGHDLRRAAGQVMQ